MTYRNRQLLDLAKHAPCCARFDHDCKPGTVMNIYEHIAFQDGSLGTIWGPCSDGTKLICDCPQCEHANKLEAEGKDWNDEYKAARLRGFGS